MGSTEATACHLAVDGEGWGGHLDMLAEALAGAAVFESAVVLAAADPIAAVGPINAVRLEDGSGRRASTTVLTVPHSKGDVVVSTWGLAAAADVSAVTAALQAWPDLWLVPRGLPLNDTGALFEVRRAVGGTATAPPSNVVLEGALRLDDGRLQLTSVAYHGHDHGHDPGVVGSLAGLMELG